MKQKRFKNGFFITCLFLFLMLIVGGKAHALERWFQQFEKYPADVVYAQYLQPRTLEYLATADNKNETIGDNQPQKNMTAFSSTTQRIDNTGEHDFRTLGKGKFGN